MSTIKPRSLTITVKGDVNKITSIFLQVFLAQYRLTDRQLDVTTALVKRYAKYIADGVIEPYASTLLFSTESRKEIVKELGISAAHLNNTFTPLCENNILAKGDTGYTINPDILPVDTLTFSFKADEK